MSLPPQSIFAPRLTVEERRAQGREIRKRVPRSSHTGWKPAENRFDPIALLEQQAAARVPDLVPIRYGRMMQTPFTFYRGSALVMARDLERTPDSGIQAQLCGDAHLLNFGAFASPERTLLFDINDFDETLPGPWEWDVKRLAASIEIAGRDLGFNRDLRRDAVLGMVERFCSAMREYSEMRHLDVWYSRIVVDEIMEMLTDQGSLKRAQKYADKARRKTSVGALEKLTEVVDGQHRIIENPPIIVRRDLSTWEAEAVFGWWSEYLTSLPAERRHLLEQYHFTDFARKVVGVGSVGARADIVLLLGRDESDPLFLQFKEAQRSVVEGPGRVSIYQNQGERVVVGQRLMQAASDIFLGWMHAAGADFYWRQLLDMKGSIDITRLQPYGFLFYARLCGWTLARAHACGGDRIRLSAYLGNGGPLGQGIADFAKEYADQAERDHQSLVDAVRAGRIAAETGI